MQLTKAQLDVVERYKATGRVAFVYPIIGKISLNGGPRIGFKRAIDQMKLVLASDAERGASELSPVATSLTRETPKDEAANRLRNALAELVEICRVKCSPTDEVILPAGRTNHEALCEAIAALNGYDGYDVNSVARGVVARYEAGEITKEQGQRQISGLLASLLK